MANKRDNSIILFDAIRTLFCTDVHSLALFLH